MRDDFTYETKNNVAHRVNGHCSNPECRAATSGPHTDTEKALNVGVAAHITAASTRGPRYDPELTTEQRKSAENAIWLCQTCAHRIDADFPRFPAKLLREWKADAELAALAHVAKNVELRPPDRDELWRLFKKYTPETTAEFLFREGYDALASADPAISYAIEIQEHGVSVTARSKDGEPISASFTPIFDDTEQGREKAEGFKRFLEEGTSVELDETNLVVDELPDPIRRSLRSHGGPFKLRMGPRRPRTFAVAISMLNEDGSSFEFPYIEFGTNHFAGEAVVLSNAQQKIPFHIEETLHPDGRGEFSWRYTGRTFWWLRELARFQRIIANPSQVIIRDLDDGLEHVAGVFSVESDPQQFPIELIERVLEVQRKTKTAIAIPKRPFFTNEDVAQLTFIEHILNFGRQLRAPDSIGVTITSKEGRDALQNSTNLEHSIAQVLPSHSELLLDTPIPLGPVELSCTRAIVHADDKARLREFLEGAEVPLPTHFRFVAAAESEIEVRYLAWPSVGGEI